MDLVQLPFLLHQWDPILLLASFRPTPPHFPTMKCLPLPHPWIHAVEECLPKVTEVFPPQPLFVLFFGGCTWVGTGSLAKEKLGAGELVDPLELAG